MLRCPSIAQLAWYQLLQMTEDRLSHLISWRTPFVWLSWSAYTMMWYMRWCEIVIPSSFPQPIFNKYEKELMYAFYTWASNMTNTVLSGHTNIQVKMQHKSFCSFHVTFLDMRLILLCSFHPYMEKFKPFVNRIWE